MTEASHILQTKVAKTAEALVERVEGRCHITLVALYNGVAAGGTGFCSNLDLESLVATIEARIARWCNAPLPPSDAAIWLPGATEFAALAEFCRQELPLAAAFALLCGGGVDHVIAGSVSPLADLLPFFSHVLLPQFKARQVVTPLEVTT